MKDCNEDPFSDHIILTMNRIVPVDDTLYQMMQHIFAWANQMGLEGKQCIAFRMIEEPDSSPMMCSGSDRTMFACKVRKLDGEESK